MAIELATPPNFDGSLDPEAQTRFRRNQLRHALTK
jgi:hypothetical protein